MTSLLAARLQITVAPAWAMETEGASGAHRSSHVHPQHQLRQRPAGEHQPRAKGHRRLSAQADAAHLRRCRCEVALFIRFPVMGSSVLGTRPKICPFCITAAQSYSRWRTFTGRPTTVTTSRFLVASSTVARASSAPRSSVS